MVASESRLTNQRFCLLKVPFMLIHSVMTVVRAQIQVTALVSKVTAHRLSDTICRTYNHIVVQSSPINVSQSGVKRMATAQRMVNSVQPRNRSYASAPVW